MSPQRDDDDDDDDDDKERQGYSANGPWKAEMSNCQTPCQGIYADITQWHRCLDVQMDTMGTTEDVMQPILTEYKIFKKNNVKHFRFNSSATATVFGMVE